MNSRNLHNHIRTTARVGIKITSMTWASSQITYYYYELPCFEFPRHGAIAYFDIFSLNEYESHNRNCRSITVSKICAYISKTDYGT